MRDLLHYAVLIGSIFAINTSVFSFISMGDQPRLIRIFSSPYSWTQAAQDQISIVHCRPGSMCFSAFMIKKK